MALSTINAAVRRQDSNRTEALLDRIFAFWFTRFVYNQIWEDPEVDLAALAIDPSCRVVTIASGGCNVLNYLVADPAEIVAVDLNPAHVALTRLKIDALRYLPDYNSFFQFFGVAKDRANVTLYERHLHDKLDEATRRFWDHRTVLGRRRIAFFAKGLYYKALLGKFIGFLHGFARLQGQHPSLIVVAQSLAEQRSIFAAEIEPLFRTRLVRLLSRHPFILYSLGIPPSQFASLVEASGGDLAGLYHDRVRHLACDFSLSENYFAWQAFGRRYGSDSEAAFPPYLQRRNYDPIRSRLPRITTPRSSMTGWPRGEPHDMRDPSILLDTASWMGRPTLAA